MASRGTHESYDRDDRTRMGSDRTFGLIFAVLFAVIAVLKLLAGHSVLGWVALWAVLAVLALAMALLAPRWLRPLNRLWFRFGLLLHHIVSPIVMGGVFFLAVTPTGLIMRALGRRPLNLSFDPEADSYWIERRPPGPPRGSFTNQF